MLSAQLRGKGKEGFPTLHKHFEPLNWSPAPKIPVAIFCSLTAAPDEIILHWTNTLRIDKGQKGVKLFTSSTSKMKASHLSKAFSLQPIILCLPTQKVQLHHELGWDMLRRSESPNSTRWNLFLGRCELNLLSITFCPQPHPDSSKQSSKHWLWAIKALVLENAQKTLEPQPCWCRGTRQSLQAVNRSSFPILLFKAASWAPAMLWRAQALGQQGCHRSRKGGRSTIAQLPHWACVWGWQVHWQLFLSFLDFCVCLKSCTSLAIQTGTQKIGLEMPR